MPVTMTVFVLLMLASVTFDGLVDTSLWPVVLRGVHDIAAGVLITSPPDELVAAVAWVVFAALFVLV